MQERYLNEESDFDYSKYLKYDEPKDINKGDEDSPSEKHSDKIDNGIYVLMLGSLALLDHGLDGSNIEAMSEAKKKLQEHLAKNY